MWMNLSPLKRNRDFRYLYLGQFITFFGTMMSLVALPFQVYDLTHSTTAVGLLGVVELVPLLLTVFVGGALADMMDRRKMLMTAELGMSVGIVGLIINALLLNQHLWVIYAIAAYLSALTGLHRPSLDALMPRLISNDEIQSLSVLSMFKSTVCLVCGPAIAGLCIANIGLAWTYTVDLVTFVVSIGAMSRIQSIAPPEQQQRPSFQLVYEAIRYAVSRQELLGTFIIDFVAMILAMPNALFPALALILGGTKTLGWLYAAPALGALVITVLSGWTQRIKRHGAAVALAAIAWGAAITCVGFMSQLGWVLFFLGLAGAFDCISGIFRATIWNETIPNTLRGRMASLEMISYMSGPLLGNTQIGFLASMTSTQMAIQIGGTLCVVAVIVSALLLPLFWRYCGRSLPTTQQQADT
ncbi:MAG: MFS transporter [Legionellaceae bacterium]|nr:MFS transporter [Legionellaceae bacterium]